MFPIATRSLATITLLTSATGNSATAQQANRPVLPDRRVVPAVDTYLAPLDAAGQLSGALLIARGGRILYERSFGKSNYETGAPNGPATVYAIASLTKPLTIIAAMRLIDRGELENDHLLARYIPDFPSADRITVDMLLRHRSGIPHRVTGPADEADPKTPAEMVRLAAARPLTFEPGSSSLYSTAGYSVLARVLEIASGKRYGDLLRETVLAPAGATHTVDPDGRRLIPGRAPSFVPGADGFERAPARELSFLVGGGSAYSTPRDVHAVIAALLAGTYGPAARSRLVQQGVIRWNGVTNGYRSFADHDSAAGTTIVFTGNVHTGAIDMLRRDLPRLLAGEAVPAPTPPRVVPRPVAAAARAAATGSYDVYGSPVLLRFDQPGIATFGDRVLFAVNDSTLFSPQDYAEVSMVRGAAGRVDTLRWGSDGPRFARSAPGR